MAQVAIEMANFPHMPINHLCHKFSTVKKQLLSVIGQKHIFFEQITKKKLTLPPTLSLQNCRDQLMQNPAVTRQQLPSKIHIVIINKQ